MIELRNISKSFSLQKQSFKALDQVNLTVAEGEILGIIGFSGAGKSTLIRCINLLERPDEGQVLVKGMDLGQLNARELARARKKIGMIFQHFNLLSSQTVFDNVALPLVLEHLPKAKISQTVTRLLKLVGLEDKAKEYPKNLSGGQKQRVAIARALANDPYVLLCDEATSALDPATTQSILQLLQDINRRLGITIVLITHEMEVIKAICNEVAVIDQGKLITKGNPEALNADPEHPIIKQFLNPTIMTLPQQLNSKLREVPQDGLFPLIEIQLNGNISFDKLLSLITAGAKAPYKLLKADVTYSGNTNFGKVLLQLQGNTTENATIMQSFHQHNIKNTLKGYA
ncbi:DL-methionine transporter ATP-binding subunit [Taibaiella sp. KBW10]|uniref:methionine ABC transporter ATP-binding protein n=1 Tax=Taibaiella sp. KBW10 TaxID=2153357 RepID=UPI000F5B3359|nr:ATP-binding cassette domain-containing protein [Taibaiella sp. KBW10]RQO32570.1 DL-methionine transporter ATP-binding subunit [Taibaiella sp. KBW10]